MDLFTRHQIFTEEEIRSRYEIFLENYRKTIYIEAKTLVEMAEKEFLPSLLAYTGDMIKIAFAKQNFLSRTASDAEKFFIEHLSSGYEEAFQLLSDLKSSLCTAQAISDPLKNAQYCHDTLLSSMEKLRATLDDLETRMPSDYLPYPTYDQLLFSI